jgi:hypothetical protein
VSLVLQAMIKTKKGGKSPLGKKITELARKRGYAKPSDFAHAHDINIRTFNDLLYGYTKIMPDSLLRVCEKLDVEPWELLAPPQIRPQASGPTLSHAALILLAYEMGSQHTRNVIDAAVGAELADRNLDEIFARAKSQLQKVREAKDS